MGRGREWDGGQASTLGGQGRKHPEGTERSQAMEGGARAWETEVGDGQSRIRSRALVGKRAVVRGVAQSEAQTQGCLERWHPFLPAPIATMAREPFPCYWESVNTPSLLPSMLCVLRLERMVTRLVSQHEPSSHRGEVPRSC